MDNKTIDTIIEKATEKYVHDIAGDDAVNNMSAEEEQNMMAKKDEIYNNVIARIKTEQHKKRFPKKRLIICVAIIAILAVGALSGSALKEYIFKTSANLNENSLVIKTEKIDSGKYDAIKEFEEKDKLIIPDWLPQGVELKKIIDDYHMVTIRYESNDKWIELSEKIIPDNGQIDMITENNTYKVGDINILNMSGVIVKLSGELDTNAYTAVWNSDKIQYNLDANISEKEFRSVLNKLKFLK